MKIINTLLKPLGLTLMKRDQAVDMVENNICFQLIKIYVAKNWHMYEGSRIGNLLLDKE
jgi:hypothetical protein